VFVAAIYSFMLLSSGFVVAQSGLQSYIQTRARAYVTLHHNGAGRPPEIHAVGTHRSGAT
jgi:hypothetical protein